MPLRHVESSAACDIEKNQLPLQLRPLIKRIRALSQQHVEAGGDWHAVVNGLRKYLPSLWTSIDTADKKRFLRHGLSYWNIHRHRVHWQLANVMSDLAARGQLIVLAGRIQQVKDGKASISLRHHHEIKHVETKWLINCIGPSLIMAKDQSKLVTSLVQQALVAFDVLNLGFAATAEGALKDAAGNESPLLYALGPPTKGEYWGSTSVPDIRKQIFKLATYLVS
jgi:uncharacterized NAD(P)/FAD-binding protein YdhS